ncbi:MAG: hypothetical protein HYT80_12030 [Euryarchaeota archaeon]|nr:hypothetical protein [Euryarchaeota archaeon]
MTTGRFAVAVAVLLFFLPPQASAEPCQEINYPGGSIKQGDCSGSAPAKDDPWWATGVAQTIYSIAGIGLAGAGAFFGWNRVRQRRKTLRQFMEEADMAYAISKNEPEAGVEKLIGLRAELHARHEHAKIDDAQFLALDRKIADFVAKLRVIDIELRFPDLNVEVVREIRHAVEDGHLSSGDIRRIEKLATSLRVPAETRRMLSTYLKTWVTAEKTPPVVPQPVFAPAR